MGMFLLQRVSDGTWKSVWDTSGSNVVGLCAKGSRGLAFWRPRVGVSFRRRLGRGLGMFFGHS